MNYYTMKKQLDDLIKLTIKPAIWEDIIGDDVDDEDVARVYEECIEYIKENL